MEAFISVKRARELLDQHVTQLAPSSMPIKDTLGWILAEDISSPKNIPDFLQSSMDGYAIQWDEHTNAYTIVGQIQAGQPSDLVIHHGQAVRIFTGAPVPNGADTVVVQEKVRIHHHSIILEDPFIKKGDHVRTIGSEISKDAIALEKGIELNAAAIGVMASLGYEHVQVIAPPKVTIIITGNEIRRPGENILPGQVYDSSSFSLSALLKKIGCNIIHVRYVEDQLETQIAVLKDAIQNSDLVLATGGVSVGDFDFTKQAFDGCRVEAVFHKIKQKPGKPLLFGMYQHKPIFGLPGNPASVLTCFYEYVYPVIGRMMGKDFTLHSMKLPITHDHTKNTGLTHFLKAYSDHNTVKILSGQESYKIASLAKANVYVVLDEAITEVKTGDSVEVHFIPY